MKSSKDSVYQSLTLIHLVLFRIIEVLPRDDASPSSNPVTRYLPNGYCHVITTLLNTMYLGYGLRMLLLTRGLDLDYVCEVVIVQGVCLRYLVLYRQRWDLLELTETCRDLWRTFVRREEAEIVRAFERKAYYLRNFFLWSGLLVVTFYVLTAHFVRIPAAEVNATAVRILPYNLITITIRSTVGYAISVILTGIESVGPFLVMMACGYFRTVHRRLALMAPRAGVEVLSSDEVLVCVKFHQKILLFCEKIDKFMRGIFMVQVVCTLYNMSLIGIKLLENDKNAGRYMTLLILSLLQFFTCQWIPEHLLNESEAITDAAYGATLMHRRFNARANRMLLMMITRANKPVQLTAGGIVSLSLESFQKLIVNAFSFFTMLRNFAA